MSAHRSHSPTAAFLATFRGLLSDVAFRIAAAFLGVMIALGTIVYMIVEEWTLLDSLYFSVITASTVGFGDFTPVTDIGKIYTMIYVLVTTGLLLLVLSRVATEMIANRVETGRTARDANEPGADDASGDASISRLK